MEIPKYITEMDHNEFLECLDDFGDGYYWIHEAAKRIRKFKEVVKKQNEEILRRLNHCTCASVDSDTIRIIRINPNCPVHGS